jgi:hypothetical protein
MEALTRAPYWVEETQPQRNQPGTGIASFSRTHKHSRLFVLSTVYPSNEYDR